MARLVLPSETVEVGCVFATLKMKEPGLHAQPDSGKWTAKSRYDGLTKAFPLAVTCDFKAKELGLASEHSAHDLYRCLMIA